MERPRIVVCGLGGNLAFGLPESVWNDGAWVGGGERDLYELAFAAACLGYEVELRGSVSKPVYDEFAASCPGRPSVGDALRSPRPEEIVIVPEGWPEAERYLAAMAWPNRLVMLVMAPLGLFGWAFDGPARIPDPLTVEPSDLHRPEQIRMVDALGFELWSNAEQLASDIESAGVACRWVGNGTPLDPPARVEKDVDVVVIGGNRWEALAGPIADRIGGRTIRTPDDCSNQDILHALNRARLFVHPARVEGHSRLANEARSVGAVPIMLSSNIYLAHPDEAHGLVLGDDADDMVAAARALLSDPARLAELSERARTTAADWMAWEPYLERIGEAIEHPPTGPRLRPLATLGAQVTELLGFQAAHDAARFRAEIDGIEQRAEQQRLLLEQARDESEREATELRNDLRKAEAELDAIRHTVTWRLRDRLVSIRAVQRWRAR